MPKQVSDLQLTPSAAACTWQLAMLAASGADVSCSRVSAIT